jgi:hypothetical protein
VSYEDEQTPDTEDTDTVDLGESPIVLPQSDLEGKE